MRRKEREITDIQLMEEIIAKADVCRVAFANEDVPYIVTMNFGYQGGENPRFWFHGAGQGRKIDMIRKNKYVCFELDTDHEIYTGPRGCDWGMRYKSIVGYGNISIVSELPEKTEGLNFIMKHYAGNSEYSFDESIVIRTTVLMLEIKEITAKKC
jgi:nitroimidazol reductase NimA-like FMN-containing flavoprotein (pyridoxamine 5'-phosphate oxidase superfamily)